MKKIKVVQIIFIIIAISIILNIPKTYAKEKSITFITQIANKINDVVSAEKEENKVEIQCEDEVFYNKLIEALQKENAQILQKDDENLLFTMTNEEIEKITKLEIYDYGAEGLIEKITGIEKFVNLEELLIGNEQNSASSTQYTNISDVRNLVNLTKLKRLYLNDNNLNDVSVFAEMKNLECLQLNGNEITNNSNLNELTKLENLNELSLELNQITDISDISKMINLKNLFLSNNEISDVSQLSKLTKLENLSLANNKINGDSNVNELSKLKNLNYLSLMNNDIEDISELSSLQNLIQIDLARNKISDIGALMNLTNLRYLHVYNQKILLSSTNREVRLPQIIQATQDSNSKVYTSKALKLENCELLPGEEKIKVLDTSKQAKIIVQDGNAEGTTVTITVEEPLYDNIVNIKCEDEVFYNLLKEAIERQNIEIEGKNDETTTITMLQSNIDKVETLEIIGNTTGEKMTKITGIRNFTNLKNLSITFGQISNISEISRLTNLKYLRLAINQITDIKALSGLINLEDLELYDNQITDISALSGLINLEVLELYDNQITDISALSGLINLRHLELGFNQITDINELSGLTNLRVLGLENNQIADISVLSGLTNLSSLGLGNNPIADISVLSGLTNLDHLWLNSNQIKDINDLSGLTNLSYLDLSVNQITDISVLSGLTNLEVLWLNSNQITDINALSGLTNLRYLHLEYNQITDISALSVLTNIQNQKIYYEIKDTSQEIEVPQIVKATKQEGSLVYTDKDLTLENCEISGDVIKINQFPATITINGGKAYGTKIEIKSSEESEIESEKYSVEEDIITKILPNTTKSDFYSLITATEEYEILDKNNERIEDESIIGTGYTLKMESGKTYTLVLNGDVDGNGIADIYDIIKINNYRISQKGLTEYEKRAADVDGDGKIGIYDMTRINNYRISGKGL